MIFDQKHNVLVYDTPLRDRLVQALPEARTLHNGYVAFPRTLYNCQVAQWMGLPTPPIMDDYDWPIAPGRRPLAHQMLCANFHVLNPRCFNLSDMGTMKTLSALWSADYLMRANKVKTLVVCPRSIRQRVWGDEIFANFIGRRSFEILEGTAEKRVKTINKNADFYIINHDGVKIGARRKGRRRWEFEGLSKQLQERRDIQIVIIDEADAYKDGSTNRSRVTHGLLADRCYLWLMTGTPTPTAPTDAHGLALFVNNANGETFTNFKRRTMIQLSQFKWIPHRDGYKEAQKLLQPSIRIDIKDVWDGPELTTQQREIELTSHQQQLLRELKNKLKIEVASGVNIIPANEADSRNKAIQICLGAVYDAGHNWHELDAQNRIKEAIAVIQQSKGKILVFIGLTSVVELVYQKLTEAGIACAKVTGATSDKDRNAIFDAFQNEELPRVILADPGTMAHGLNLYAATTVLWFGPTDKTGLYLQGNKRAHRPGQRHPVTVVQFVSSALERQIFKRLENNETLQGTLLDWIRSEQL